MVTFRSVRIEQKLYVPPVKVSDVPFGMFSGPYAPAANVLLSPGRSVTGVLPQVMVGIGQNGAVNGSTGVPVVPRITTPEPCGRWLAKTSKTLGVVPAAPKA